LNILLVNNEQKKDTVHMVQHLEKWFTARGVKVDVQSLSLFQPVKKDIDLVMVLGGDGTILKVARELAGRNIPLLGVNMGTVGFLCNFEGHDIDRYLEPILAGRYTLEERMMLEVSLAEDDCPVYKSCCMNEIVARSHTTNMIKLEVSIDDEEIEPYRGDGIIIATPTGSTAYSLSCGGPVVDPRLDAIIMTPIASYKVTKRPLVIHPARVIRIKPLECQKAVISIDGQVNIDLRANYSIKVNTAPTRLKFAALNRRPFFTLVDRTGK